MLTISESDKKMTIKIKNLGGNTGCTKCWFLVDLEPFSFQSIFTRGMRKLFQFPALYTLPTGKSGHVS
jgi:hypothetical protein